MSGPVRQVVVNGRFRTRRLTGVQRYADETVRRLGGRVRPVMPARSSGALAGHLWEQLILPARLPRGGLLWSPANTGPLLVRNQVVTIHDTSVLEHPEWFNPLFAAWYAFLLPRLIARVRRVLTVSEHSRRRLVRLCSIPEERMSVVPEGVDLERFHPCDPDAVRARYSLGGRYVLFVGSLEPRKNLAGLLRAWNRMNGPEEVELVIAGASAHVFKRVRFEEIPPSVRFLGYVPDADLPGLYSGAAGCVNLSLDEGFGLTVLEAMACGTPVVASSAGALPEVAGGAGLLVDPCRADEVARALERVLCDPAVSADLRCRGLERARQFSWERAAESIWDVLQDV